MRNHYHSLHQMAGDLGGWQTLNGVRVTNRDFGSDLNHPEVLMIEDGIYVYATGDCMDFSSMSIVQRLGGASSKVYKEVAVITLKWVGGSERNCTVGTLPANNAEQVANLPPRLLLAFLKFLHLVHTAKANRIGLNTRPEDPPPKPTEWGSLRGKFRLVDLVLRRFLKNDAPSLTRPEGSAKFLFPGLGLIGSSALLGMAEYEYERTHKSKLSLDTVGKLEPDGVSLLVAGQKDKVLFVVQLILKHEPTSLIGFF